MLMLLKNLKLSKKGMADMRRSVFFTVLKKLACLIPFVIIAFMMREIMGGRGDGTLRKSSLFIFCVIGLIGFVLTWVTVRLAFLRNFIPAYHEVKDLRFRLAACVSELPMQFHNTKETTDITGAISTDCVTMETVICTLFPELTGNIIFAGCAVVILACINLRLALVMLLTMPVAFLVEFASLRLQKRLTKTQIRAKQKMTTEMQQYIDGIRVVKAYRLGGEQNLRLCEALEEMQNASMRLELISGIFITGAEVILNLGIGLVIWVSALMFTDGQISFLTIMIFSMSVLCIYESATETIELISGLTYMKAAVERIGEILDAERVSGEANISLDGYDIRFEHVSFSYREGEKEVLKDINLTIKEGEVTALVGPSGCGKTTLARLAVGFWRPDLGKITLGGFDISKADPFAVTAYFSTVFQDVVLFHDSIENNIRIGDETASDEAVLAAAEEACCMDFIDKLEDGIHTVIRENGNSLSGGERQRISIARAILKNAPILILDEATASLDPENEEMVQKALSAVTAKGKTVLVIAHRLRTVVDADNIVMMDDGKIIETGTHEELMHGNEQYRKMFELQSRY